MVMKGLKSIVGSFSQAVSGMMEEHRSVVWHDRIMAYKWPEKVSGMQWVGLANEDRNPFGPVEYKLSFADGRDDVSVRLNYIEEMKLSLRRHPPFVREALRKAYEEVRQPAIEFIQKHPDKAFPGSGIRPQ